MSKSACSIVGAIHASSLLPVPSASVAKTDALDVVDVLPYIKGSRTHDKIVDECPKLRKKLRRFVNAYSTYFGVTRKSLDSIDRVADGRVLVVEITDAISDGNAFVGHRKSMSAPPELFLDGASKMLRELGSEIRSGIRRRLQEFMFCPGTTYESSG